MLYLSKNLGNLESARGVHVGRDDGDPIVQLARVAELEGAKQINLNIQKAVIEKWQSNKYLFYSIFVIKLFIEALILFISNVDFGNILELLVIRLATLTTSLRPSLSGNLSCKMHLVINLATNN